MISSQVILVCIFFSILLAAVSWFVSANVVRNSSQKEIDLKFVPKVHFQELSNQLIDKNTQIQNLFSSETNLKLELEGLKSELKHLQIRITAQNGFLESSKEQTKQEFENLANKILEEKSVKFSDQNQRNISMILNPLRERIQDFEKQLKDNFEKDIVGRSELKSQIEALKEQSISLSKEAHQLTSALKGDKKMQGGWGEEQLEKILELSGLQKNIQYFKEKNIVMEDGSNVRPDYIIVLPDDKSIVLDSKVSLVDYNRYFNEDNDGLRKDFLKSHVQSIKNHIKILGSKKYETITGHSTPAYILMFIALEPAFHAAIVQDPNLFDEAMKNNIVLVTNSTLLATLRTVYFLWKQDSQNKNAFEIANEGGKLYEKFHGFIEDMLKLEKDLVNAEKSFNAAMNKLYTSTKKGDTIIGRINKLKALGAKTEKNIPLDFIPKLETKELLSSLGSSINSTNFGEEE